MLKLGAKIVAVTSAGILSLQLVQPVLAVGPLETFKQERKEIREQIKDEVREKTGSRPGLLRFFSQRSRAAIGSGTISAISGTTLTITREGKIYTVLTDDKTQFRRRFWGKSSLSEMQIGDMVNVIGLWTDDAKTTIQARLVRDLSIQKRLGVFFGVVQSLTSTGWTMQTKRGLETVTISSGTKLVDRRGQVITQGDIKVGHRVRVRGLWDTKNSTLTEVTELKDYSLPVKPTPTLTPTVTP